MAGLLLRTNIKPHIMYAGYSPASWQAILVITEYTLQTRAADVGLTAKTPAVAVPKGRKCGVGVDVVEYYRE